MSKEPQTNLGPSREQDRVDVLGFQPGDVVELKSGSFAMVVTDVIGTDGGERLRVFWDTNGPMSGRACSLSTAQLPASSFKIFVPYDQRPQDGDIPF
ncbi:hypothetical protein [Rhizobium sp. SGZ-381]|uniref:hypothetical protein n=1 Tax=Rhizobium sp. SGZ-381 TaxID=3342800 RepID=UPI0036724705